MNSEIVLAPDASPDLMEALNIAKSLVIESAAEASRKGYASDFSHFSNWASTHGFCPLPASPQTVTLYVAMMSRDYALSTILRRLTSIGYAHRGQPVNPASTSHPLLGAAMKGLRRTKGTAHHQKDPLLTAEIRRIVRAGRGLLGKRNAALLLLGFSGGLRRAELSALNCCDVTWHDGLGITVHIRRSKTDGTAKGRIIGIPYGADDTTCPVHALKQWLEIAGNPSGNEPIFRGVARGRVSATRLNSDSIGRIIKKAARSVGLSPFNLSGHSLRAGHVSQAALAGPALDEATVMSQTGHTSPEMFRRYRRMRDIFTLNSAAHLGL